MAPLVFDNASCERRGIRPLEFDGRQDSIFRPFDRPGRHHMDYVDFIGECADLPYAEFAAEMRRAWPRMPEFQEQERMASR